MSNQSRSKTRLSRALGVALTPKAARYMEKRPYAPGEHGRTKRKQDSDYAVRLREKQRLRAQYGIREKQLKIAYVEAKRTDGLTGENLVELLEMRLDAIVRRESVSEGFAKGGSATDRTRSPVTLSQPRSRIRLQARGNDITEPCRAPPDRSPEARTSAPATYDAAELGEPGRHLALVAVLGGLVVDGAAE